MRTKKQLVKSSEGVDTERAIQFRRREEYSFVQVTFPGFLDPLSSIKNMND